MLNLPVLVRDWIIRDPAAGQLPGFRAPLLCAEGASRSGPNSFESVSRQTLTIPRTNIGPSSQKFKASRTKIREAKVFSTCNVGSCKRRSRSRPGRLLSCRRFVDSCQVTAGADNGGSLVYGILRKFVVCIVSPRTGSFVGRTTSSAQRFLMIM